MYCVCGMTLDYKNVSEDRGCPSCGGTLQFDADDFLLHGANGLVKEIRMSQVDMARLVEKGIRDREYILVEAGVGTGKTFAYLIPSMLEGKRVVISTAKKQLQHQIAYKDAPFLKEKLEKPDVQVAMRKGKSNYACRQAVERVEKTYGDKAEYKELAAWLENSDTGDLSEYPGRKPFFWSGVSAQDCIGAACPKAKDCGYFTSKQNSKTAQVVIANHHLVAFDLKFGPFSILGPYDVLVIDEAHQAEGSFRGAFSVELRPSFPKTLSKSFYEWNGSSPTECDQLARAWDTMFAMLQGFEGEVPANPFGPAAQDGLKWLAELRAFAAKALSETGVSLGRKTSDDSEEEDELIPQSQHADIGLAFMINSTIKMIDRAKEAINASVEPNDNQVVYVEKLKIRDEETRHLKVMPVNVGTLIGPKLACIPTVIVTSGTIAVNGSFDSIKKRLGLTWRSNASASAPPVSGAVPMAQVASAACEFDHKIEELILTSPFDYDRQAVLYLPKHLPLPYSGDQYDPKRRDYISKLATEIAKLIKVSEGNAFILFTSTVDMKDVFNQMAQEDCGGFPLILHDGDAEATLKRYMSTPKSTLFGLKSFWEGVDVVGQKLRLVVITKLPFPNISDPVIKAMERKERAAAQAQGINENEIRGILFRNIQVPAMVTDLRQGAGRLVRSKTDRGVVAILDPRVWTGRAAVPPPAQMKQQGYGYTAVASIGINNQTSDFAKVAKYLSWLVAKEKE